MDWKNKVKPLVFLTIVVVAVQLLLSQVIYPLIPGVATTQQVFSISPQTALTSPTIGTKILGVLTGIIPFNLGNLTNWLVLFLGAFVLLVAGLFIYDKVPRMMQGKNIWWRVALILLYGTAVLYLVLMLTGWSNIAPIAGPLLIGLAVNYAVVALAVVGLAKTKIGSKFLRI